MWYLITGMLPQRELPLKVDVYPEMSEANEGALT